MNGAQSGATSTPSSEADVLGEERLFDLLGNERRRSCLQCLAAVDGTMTVQDLASQVAVRVSDEGNSPAEIRDSVYISLCQNHLPKLDDAGVVDYDDADKTVGQGPTFPVVERHLLADPARSPAGTPTRYYLLASAVTAVVLGAAMSGAAPALSYGLPALTAVHALVAVALGRRLR